ncbi:hypothetical protein [Paenibacillus sp. NPDC057967]|uniref:hypothetical protein n=1 Tax=Paenibacillus sp. NPDC057967 TaxID=3346293 RepID=UPI0036DCE2B3
MSLKTKNLSFDMHHFHTWRTFTLAIIMQVSLLMFIWTAFLIQSDLKVPLMILTFLISFITLVWHIIEVRKIVKLVVAQDQLQFGSMILPADNIDEVVLAGDQITIELVHKIHSYTVLRLKLKQKAQAKQLNQALLLFCAEQLVEIKDEMRIVSHVV